MTIVAAFDAWREAYLDEHVDIRFFCQEKYISHANCSLIEETRGQLVRLLIGVKSVGSDVIDKRRYARVFLMSRNHGVVSTMISESYNCASGVAPLVAITFGLYPNVLSVVPDGTSDRPQGLVLQSSDSAGFVSPHKHKSAYWNEDLYAKQLTKNTWFTYHLLSRVQSGGSGGGKLRVWDLTRISTMYILFLSNVFLIDYRGGFVEIDDGVRVLCSPRSAVALVGMRKRVRDVLERGCMGFVLRRAEVEVVRMLLEVLKGDDGK
jgi:hypothetical protein